MQVLRKDNHRFPSGMTTKKLLPHYYLGARNNIGVAMSRDRV